MGRFNRDACGIQFLEPAGGKPVGETSGLAWIWLVPPGTKSPGRHASRGDPGEEGEAMTDVQRGPSFISIYLKSSLVILLTAFTCRPALSQQNTEDEYARAPARIRVLEGSASVQRAAEGAQVFATVNLPLLHGDAVSVGGGRMELQLPDGSLLWLAEGTLLEFMGLRDPQEMSQDSTVLRLRSGVLGIDSRGSRDDSESDFRIDTPEISVYPLGQGRFRLESDGTFATLTTFRGVAELAGDGGSVLVRSGQRSRAGKGSVPEDPWPVNTFRIDEFDEWCEQREAGYISGRDEGEDEGEYVEAIASPVRPYVAELDYYGDWQYVGVYGWVWRPAVYQVGWRPYFNGYWTWCPRGWTWVSYEPWGWGPYHYGRWQWVTTAGWVWIPGAVYSGAWVSWAVTPSHVGWCPLDYYNHPLFNVNVNQRTVNKYDGRGWNFVPIDRLSERNATRIIVKPDRVPQLQGAVLTSSLPRFSPEEARTRPGVAERIYREAQVSSPRTAGSSSTANSRPVPFRDLDRREGNPPSGRGAGSRGSSGAAVHSVSSPFLRTPPLQKSRELGRPGQPLPKTLVPRETVGPRKNPSEPVRIPESFRAPRRRLPGAGLPAPTPPTRPEDPSQRVFRRIFPERSRPDAPQQDSKNSPRATLGRSGGGRLPEELRTPQPRPVPRMEPSRSRPQPPKPPPPRDRDKKKDKP